MSVDIRDLPPEAVRYTAFCVPCQKNVTTDRTHACPDCGTVTDHRSWGRGRVLDAPFMLVAPPAQEAHAACMGPEAEYARNGDASSTRVPCVVCGHQADDLDGVVQCAFCAALWRELQTRKAAQGDLWREPA